MSGKITAGGSRPAVLATAVGLLLLALPAAGAEAATIQVNTNADPGTMSQCSLREAIYAANNNATGGAAGACTAGDMAGTDTITFAPGVTSPIQLATLELHLTSDITIVGPGMGALTVNAAPSQRVFETDSGTTVSISGLTISGGAPTPGTEAQGGGIKGNGNLTLTNVAVQNNAVSKSTAVVATTAFASGGGIYFSGGGSLVLDHSIVSNNMATAGNTANDGGTAEARGGGIYTDDGALTITNSSVTGNTATATDVNLGTVQASGGIRAGGDFSVDHSTFSGNTASATNPDAGSSANAVGAILALGLGTSSLELSTVAGNQEHAQAPIGGTTTGGIDNETGTALTIDSSTLALNGATTGAPAGASLFDDSGTATFRNTILADPRANAKNCFNPGIGPTTSTGFNVDYSVGGASCFASTRATDLTTNPLLDPAGLANNGGPTQTIALQSTSPAIDDGSSTGATDSTHDQRGLARPVDFGGITNAVGGNGTDIGAFEVRATCAGQASPGGACPPTGQRKAALKKCKKKHKHKARKRCRKRAKQLPV